MDSIPHLKRCTKCGVEKPLDQFYKSKQHADGLFPWCKACKRGYDQRPETRQRAYAHKKKPEVRERSRAQERLRNQQPEAKERKHRNWAKWAAKPENRERMQARQRHTWHERPEVRERKRIAMGRRYRENPEHRRKQIAHSMAAIHRRRARKRANGGTYTAREWRDLCAKYDHRCLCCGEAKPLTPDHVIPISRGGSNDISNIQCLCLDCNLRKHTKSTDYRP